MPSFRKKSLSLFLRNHCERQFILSLYGVDERKKYGLPPAEVGRAGLGLVSQAGYSWQDEKVSELQDVFGKASVHVAASTRRGRPGKIDLLSRMPQLQPYQFVVEANYDSDTNTLRSAFGLTTLTDSWGNIIDISETQPDIIQVLPSIASGEGIVSEEIPDPYTLEVQPDGSTAPLDPADQRLRLRVIDIKLTSDPGAHYFAEVVYYSITLAAWLVEHSLNDQFAVIAAPAVWPGSHEASELHQAMEAWRRKAHAPTGAEMDQALEGDLEIAPFDVFAPRLRTFFQETLPDLLSRPWQSLEWHVDYHCKGCEFLGHPLILHNKPPHDEHCWTLAEQKDHLSRVLGLTRAGSAQLQLGNIADVQGLAGTPATAPVFDNHQGLRAKRSIYPHRAGALKQNTTSIIPYSGGDALMPKRADLRIFIFLDYDLSSAITASIGMRAYWNEPLPYGSILQAKKKKWTDATGSQEVFLIDQRTLTREWEEFRKFLHELKDILNEVIKQDKADVDVNRRDKKTTHSSYQIYLWDESQRKHLVRLISRHLPAILADAKIRHLAWLFPPPELLQNPEEASRQSPITLVAPVVENTVAVPIPHHYRLLDVVKTFRNSALLAPSIHPLYQEPMSDLLPGERIHEWWVRRKNWIETQRLIEETTRKKVYALSLVAGRLGQDLKSHLSMQAAPPLVPPRPRDQGMAPHSQLWLEFTRLNAALQSLETHTIRAMPPHEREARLKSARLEKRLSGTEAQAALAALTAVSGRTLIPSPNLFVYKVRPASRDVNLKPGDFLYALSPELNHGFLDEHPFVYIKNTPLAKNYYGSSFLDGRCTTVSIEAIDRVNGFIAVRGDTDCCIADLEQHTSLDFSKNVILDPYHHDFLSSKVVLTLKGIGYPLEATEDERVLEALGLTPGSRTSFAPSSPASEVLWDGLKLHKQTVSRDFTALKPLLAAHLNQLNSSQCHAWKEALTHLFSLIWGPPGTGKSKTLRSILLGAVLDAHREQKPLRVLITANTYTAVDNVLLEVESDLAQLLPGKPYKIFRVQSKYYPAPDDLAAKHPNLPNLILNTASPSDEIKDLRDSLKSPDGIVILGCPPQQLHNLAVAGKNKRKPKDTMCSWFDFILLDEASQMDVATSTLVFTKRAENGICVLAGDHLQLPPIQQAKPPEGLEYVVGSIYEYCHRHQEIDHYPLEINYRSNQTIVDLAKLAGYSANLQSYSPDLRLCLLPTTNATTPNQAPAGWPNELCWTSNWELLLDPDYPATCFIYDDTISSQVNQFEADAVSALVWLLRQRLADRLENDKIAPSPSQTPQPYSDQEFWEGAVGLVTPHRAQRAKITDRLRQLFPAAPSDALQGAVDTVERFQGQQRDVIIASFGLGDPDLIRMEDEFLYDLNRFNVMASRARAKLIVFLTRTVLEHLSDDIDILKESRLLKHFAEAFCQNAQQITLGYIDGQRRAHVNVGVLRRR